MIKKYIGHDNVKLLKREQVTSRDKALKSWTTHTSSMIKKYIGHDKQQRSHECVHGATIEAMKKL